MEGLNGTFESKITAVQPRVMIDDNDRPRRITNIRLAFDADDDLAAGIGEACQDALRHLRSGAQKSAAIIFDAVQCKLSFNAGNVAEGKHTIDKAVGVRANLQKPGVENASPKLTLTLAIPTAHDDLWWLVQHLDESLKVKIVASQLELPGTGKKRAKKEEADSEADALPGVE